MEKPPGHVSVEEAQRLLGIRCRGSVLREYIRLGLLPYPTDGLWYDLDDIQRLMDHFEERRRKAGMSGPSR